MALAKIVLYTSKTLSDGSHPVMLRITHKGKRKYFNLGFSCTPSQWNKESSQFNSTFPKYRNRNRFLSESLFKAEDSIESQKVKHKEFSFEAFRESFIGIESKDVFQYFDEVVERMKATGKIGNANVYKDTRNAIAKFRKQKSLQFNEVDYPFLVKFEEHLRQRGALDNSISVYMRTFRALFNKAIKEKQCPAECYPFKEYQISKLKNQPSRKALSKEEIDKIISFEPDENTKQALSKDLFLFSFYTRGMNYNDIAKLTWANIADGRLNYVRSKNGKRFSIKILPPVQDILNLYKSFSSDNSYIFPILDKSHKTPEQIKNRIKSGLKRANMHLKLIAESLGITKKLTFYIARHSYALALKKNGVAIAVISETLGHDSESVTKHYLESFENEVLDKADEVLL
ncbi:MAG: site-specific integrase [Bacteroidota bacterium]